MKRKDPGIAWLTALKRFFRRWDQNKGKKQNPSEQAVQLIETAAEFVKKYQELLGCEEIIMRQSGTVGTGCVIAFYGTDRYVRSTIEKLLADTSTTWKLWEDPNDEILHITHAGTYEGSWRRFSRGVWGAVKRKHPDWKIKKNPLHEYVLYI